MLRRLKPPYKIDKATGKVLPDYIDEDGIGHFKNRRWYSNLKYKGKKFRFSNILSCFIKTGSASVDIIIIGAAAGMMLGFFMSAQTVIPLRTVFKAF